MDNVGPILGQAQFGQQTDRYGVNTSPTDNGHNSYGVSGTHFYQGGMTPLSSSASTIGSNNQATAWRTRSADPAHPAAYTAQSSGSVRSFDSAGQTPRVEPI